MANPMKAVQAMLARRKAQRAQTAPPGDPNLYPPDGSLYELMQGEDDFGMGATEPRAALPGAVEADPGVKDKGMMALDLDTDDWRKVKRPSRQEQVKITQFVSNQFKEAATSRRNMELEWALALAFKEGRQWFQINSQAQRIVKAQKDNEPLFYQKSNLMRSLLDQAQGMVTQASPDAQAVALDSEREQDRAAAEEANKIIADCNKRFLRDTQIKERVNWAITCGTSFTKIWFDPNGEQLVPVPGVDEMGMPTISHYEKMNVGAVCEEVLPPFEVYLDPTATRWQHVRWLVHATIRPLSWFVDTYGDIGKNVKADAFSGTAAGYVDSYIDGADGMGVGRFSQGYSHDARKHAAIHFEYWEKPSARFPEGRYILCTTDTLLWSGPWPYHKKDDFPFVPLRWGPQSGTPYGFSLGYELCDLQFEYNRILSKLVNQLETQKDYVLIQKLSGVGADAYTSGADIEDSNRTYRKVYYNNGATPPTVSRVPGVDQSAMLLLESIKTQMQDAAGIHDVSQGMAQAGTPAEAVMLLQKADNTQYAFIRANIEETAAAIHEWEVCLVAEFAPTPYVGLMDGNIQAGEPQSKSGILSFEALQNGGQYRVTYVPGSTKQDSPQEKMQKYLAFYQLGVLGDPSDMETNKLMVRLCKLPDAEVIIRHLDGQAQKQAAMLAEQQQMAQMAMQQGGEGGPTGPSLEEQMALKEHEAGLKAQQSQQDAQIKAELAKHDAAVKLDADAQRMVLQTKADMARSGHQAQLDIKRSAAEGIIKPHSAQLQEKLVPTPKPVVAGGGARRPAPKRPAAKKK